MKLNANEYPLIDCIISGRMQLWRNRIFSCDIEGMMFYNDLSLEKTLRNKTIDEFESATGKIWPTLSKAMRENLFIVGHDVQVRMAEFLSHGISDHVFQDGSMIGGGVMILRDGDRSSSDMFCWVFQDSDHYFLAYLHNGRVWAFGSIKWGDEDSGVRFFTKYQAFEYKDRWTFAGLVSSSYFLQSIKEETDAWGIVIRPRNAFRLEGDMLPTRNEFTKPFTYIY